MWATRIARPPTAIATIQTANLSRAGAVRTRSNPSPHQTCRPLRCDRVGHRARGVSRVSDVAANKALIERFWADMGQRDFTAVRDYFTAESHYTDVPANEEVAAGPDAIEARLRLGIEPLDDYRPKLGTMTAEDDRVIVEHSEEWFWKTGEHVELPFVSVFDVRDGKIVRWWDYWDMSTLMNAAPQWWVEHIMQGYQ